MYSPSRSPEVLSKRLRCLRKKLREVARLESFKRDCRDLRPEELEKIRRRSKLEASIAEIVQELVKARDTSSITSQDEVWEKSTGTPGSVSPVDSNDSKAQSEEAVDGSHSIEVQRMEQTSPEPISRPSLVSVDVSAGKHSTTFRVPEHMRFVKSLGHGSYGSVAAFCDTNSNERVAIKKVPVAASNDLSNGMRALREIRVLSNTHHENIVKMHCFYCDRHANHDDIYIVQECVDIDLHSVIQRSGSQLTEKHHRHILYGTTRGLSYLHSLDVAHRDLKPANILVSVTCSVKICDFNLSRGGMQGQHGGASRRAYSEHAELSDYVCTRWYRAPELMLFKGRYGKAVDVWSLGCIVHEVLTTKPAFKGSNSGEQVQQIINVIGFPFPADLDGRKLLPGAGRILRPLNNVRGRPWQLVMPAASIEACQMISCLLRFSPEKRITAKECLRQGYFTKLYRPSHEDGATSGLDWSFDESVRSEGRLRELLCGDGCAFVWQPEADTTDVN